MFFLIGSDSWKCLRSFTDFPHLQYLTAAFNVFSTAPWKLQTDSIKALGQCTVHFVEKALEKMAVASRLRDGIRKAICSSHAALENQVNVTGKV